MIESIVGSGPFGVNTYLIETEMGGSVLVVDPGGDSAQLQRAIAGRTVAAVLLTHGHFDHIGLIRSLPADVPVYIHAEDAPMLTSAMLNQSTMTSAPFTVRPADACFQESLLTIDGTQMEVMHTPGHTKGSCSLLIDGTLISGDTLFASGYGRVDLPGGDMDQMKASLKRLLALPPETRVLPGHGPETSIGKERRTYGL